MKIFINKSIRLRGLHNDFYEDFLKLLQAHDIAYQWSYDNDGEIPTVQVWVNEFFNENSKPKPPIIVEMTEENANIFLNTLSNHYYGTIKFEYLGNMRFNLIV